MNQNFGQPLKQNLLYDEVVSRIREMIVSGAIEPGSKLPSERDLAQKLGVSRVVIRDATRILNAQGLVEIKPGSGTFACSVGSDQVIDSIDLFLRMRQENNALDNLLEVRRVLEIDIAGIAAEKASPDDIASLRNNIESMLQVTNSIEEFTHLDLEFHQLVAEATGNDLFTMLLKPLSGLLLEFRMQAYEHDPDESVQGAITHHQEILDAVFSRDAERAREAMRAHIQQAESLYDYIRKKNKRS